MIVQLEDIINAMEQATEDAPFYLHPLTGEIISSDEAGEEAEEYLRLPTNRDMDDYGNMESFISERTSGEAQKWLRNAIHGRGAFRMFRAAAERFGLTQDWYDYREAMHRATAIAWCEQYGLEYDLTPSMTEDEEEDDDYEEEEESLPVTPARTPLRVVNITKDNLTSILYMADHCHTERMKKAGKKAGSDLEKAEERLRVCLQNEGVIRAVSDQGRFIGYAIIQDNILKEIYVRPENRRKGIGRMLMKALEDDMGVLQIRVEPYNDSMLWFLQKLGYSALKELTLTKQSSTREISYTMGEHKFQEGETE